MVNLVLEGISGMDPEEMVKVRDLVRVYNQHLAANAKKQRYYDGHVSLAEVNLGIALPEALANLSINCEWGAKCVDVLASRSMFDGFVGKNGEDADAIKDIADRNNIVSEYMKACRDELKFGCAFATLSSGEDGCRVRFHSPESAAAIWDGEKGRISRGLAIIAYEEDSLGQEWPSVINYYTDDAIWVLRAAEKSQRFVAERHPHRMGRPLMEPLIWNPTSAKPFGRSRLKAPIRSLIQGYVRTIANATIGLEFSTTPQKYLLGITDEQYDAVINQKFRQYIGNILAATNNPETGENPVFGQLSQGSLEPHVQMMRLLATQFSAASGLTVTDVGVVNDANPTSSDAILAQSQTLVLMAEQLNAGNTQALITIARMAQAVERNVSLEDLTEAERDIIPHFMNPAMPSVSVTADAAIKIASARQTFAETDTFLEMIGFGQADIRRIKAQEQRARGQAVLTEEFGNADNYEGLGEIYRPAGSSESGSS